MSGCIKSNSKSRVPAQQSLSKYELSEVDYKIFEDAKDNYTPALKAYSDCVIEGVQKNLFQKEVCEDLRLAAVFRANIMLEARERAIGFSFGSNPDQSVRADTRDLLDKAGVVSPPFYQM